MRLLTPCVESSDKEMAGSNPTAKMKNTAKGSNASHTQTDELARYIKELKARAKLEKVMKRLEDIQKNANGNEARLPRKTRAKQSKPTNK